MNDYTALLERIRFAPKPLVVAIDGRAASGKTTLAGIIEREFGAAVIHTDDFFLPPDLRTHERLSEAGGNVHYERLKDEVINNLKSQNGFSYGVFDCGTMAVTDTVFVEYSPVTVVEGSYSCHPYLGAYADLRVFLTVEPDEQLRRITARNGAEKAAVFKEKWIPLEEKYFDSFPIKENADFIYGGV